MATYHSQYFRGDIAVPAAGKNNGDEYQDLTSHPYKAYKDSDDGAHHGHPLGVISYDGSEFHCRISAQGKDWHFRALELDKLQDQARRFFAAERGRIKFKLDRTAWLAKDGERAALLKV